MTRKNKKSKRQAPRAADSAAPSRAAAARLPNDLTKDTRSEDEILDAFAKLYREENEAREREARREQLRQQVSNEPVSRHAPASASASADNDADADAGLEPFDPARSNMVRRMHKGIEQVLYMFQEVRHVHQTHAILTNYAVDLQLVLQSGCASVRTRPYKTAAFTETGMSVAWHYETDPFDPNDQQCVCVTASYQELFMFVYGLLGCCDPFDKHTADPLWTCLLRWVRCWMLPPLAAQKESRTYEPRLDRIVFRPSHGATPSSTDVAHVVQDDMPPVQQLCDDFRTTWMAYVDGAAPHG